MRRNLNLLRRHVVVWAVMISCGSCSGHEAPPQVAALGDEPAQVILLADATANWFLELEPPPPPDGRVVVAGGDHGEVLALVLGRELRDAQEQLSRLVVFGDIEGCVPAGITCCDVETKTYVLDGAFESERFWLRLGERCEGAAPRDGFDHGAPVDEPSAGVVEIDPEIMDTLAAYGVTYPFMTLAEETGNGRIVFDPRYESTNLGLSPPMMNRLGLQERSSIILAGHETSNRPACVSSVSWCRKDDGDRCNKARRHWFRWNDAKEQWCQMSDKCSC